MTEHTKGPWLVKKGLAADGEYEIRSESADARWGLTGIRVHCQINGSGPAHGPRELVTCDEAEANARRIVSCVNACEGLDNKLLENVLMLGDTLKDRFCLLTSEIAYLSAQNASIRSALDRAKDCIAHYEAGGSTYRREAVLTIAEIDAAIAKADELRG